VRDAATVNEPRASQPFGNSLQPHLTAMWVLARRYAGGDAEDLVQEALEVAWRRRQTFDPTRGSIRTWLLVIVADRCRKRHRAARPTEELREAPAQMRDQESAVDVRTAVQALPPRQRLAVELHYVVGLSVSETADVMKCSAGTVKSTLSDARARLRILLEVAG
jgi:RNA polymerase sigma factor (sigma-70 family)